MPFADFLGMTGDDLKTLLLALIAIYLEWLRRKSNTAATAADDAKKEAATTRTLLNGRMEELLAAAREKAYAEGHAAGVAKVSKAVADAPSVPLVAQQIAKAVAETVQPPAPPAPAPTPPGGSSIIRAKP